MTTSTTATSSFDGPLLFPGDAGYESARLAAIWNGRKTTRKPAAILGARTIADVQRGVRLARERGWQISIRSGGHSWIATGVRDGVLLIDLSALSDVSIDADNRRATVGPGIRGSELNRLVSGHGLAFPAGHCPSVCVGGYLIGGGYGWNSRALGPACLSIEAVDIVLADGSLIHVDDESHPELMWALRGSGPGFFAIVVAFHLRLHPGYEQVLLSAMSVSEPLREEALAWSYDALPTFAAELEVVAETRPVPGTTDELETTIIATGFLGDGASADELFAPFEAAPFRADATLHADRLSVDFDGIYAVLDSKMPEGHRFSVDGIWTSRPARDVLEASSGIYASIPSEESYVLWLLWGHYPTRSNACWSAQERLYLSPNALWTNPQDDLRHEQWAHGSLDALVADGVGASTQFADANSGDRPSPGLEETAARRLEKLRHGWDPERRFVSYLSPPESTTQLAHSRRT